MTHPPGPPRPLRKLRPEERSALGRDGCEGGPPPALLRGVEEFNRGLYWECHETLEELWAAEPRDVRYLYQGILLIGVGLLHLERRNRHGAAVKLGSGLELLAPFEPSCRGVDAAALRVEARRVLDALLAEGAGLDAALAVRRPRCRLIGSDIP